jgi:hypothetical protein
MRKLLPTLLCLCTILSAAAQKFSIIGSVKDTGYKLPLKNATITLLKAKDSILVSYTRANTEGNFELKNIDTGKYSILVSYPAYADFTDVIYLTKNENLGVIAMLTKAAVLQNVIVKGSGAIKMRGDTIAFVADSFKVKEGATVEDLLKKLPGIQVNKKGEITAQGEKVEKILVDGEEFFGDDPTLATQNLNANIVKEVQVFDKKSDQATFTGIDDGVKSKTINLKLKDDANKGYFGKLNLGGGLPNRWENNAMINKFRQKKKISAFALMGNTGKIGLNWGENRQYGGNEVDMQMTDDGDMYFSSQGDEDFGWGENFRGQGLPSAWQAGISYGNKWDNDKNNVNGSYRFQKQNTTGGNNSITQTILPDTQYFNNQRSQNFASKFKHKVNGSYEIKLDSTQTLKISVNASTGKNFNTNRFNSEALAGNGLPVNQSSRNSNSTTDKKDFSTSLIWRKKMKKKGRTISLNFDQKYSENESDGKLLNYNSFFKNGLLTTRDTTDQQKINTGKTITTTNKVAYTEPIGKNGIIEINYTLNINKNEAKRLSYDKRNDKYDSLNRLFSNNFVFNTTTHLTGIAYRYTAKKYNFGFGSNIANAQWKQTNLFNDSVRNYSFINLFPRANFQYKFSQFKRINFNFNGNTTAPTLNQIQPVADNSDPLNINIGNNNLKQSFNQSYSINFSNYKVLTETNIWTGIWLNTSNNAIGNKETIDSVGRRISQTVNVNGNYNLSGYVSWGSKLKKADLRISVDGNYNLGKQNGFINGLKNTNNFSNASLSLYITKQKDDKYDITLENRVGYVTSKSSLRPDVVTKYWTYEPKLDIGLDLPGKIDFNTDINYNWRQKTSTFDNNNNVLLWNARLEKKISKKKDLKLGFKVNDLLNQNLGFSRVANSNFISQDNYDVIKRYWLITLKWNFYKGPQKGEEW